MSKLLKELKQKIADLETKLAEKDAEISNLKEQFDIFTLKNAFKYQNCMEKSKMQFAIDYTLEQLEKVKDLIYDLDIGDNYKGMYSDIKIKRIDVYEVIDNQIKELKKHN